MPTVKHVELSLKIIVNKEKNKVLFAEADSHFVDVLISFLTLPLGTTVRILKKQYEVGSLTTLYNSLAELNSENFQTEDCKKMLLNPESSFEAECSKLKLDIRSTNFYLTCRNLKCAQNNVRKSDSLIYENVTCSCCGKWMERELGHEEAESEAADVGVFTIPKGSFVIFDDLQIFPNTAGYIQTLKNLGVTDVDSVGLRRETLGFSKIMDLLKASLHSRTPLTDIIFGEREYFSKIKKSEPKTLFHPMKREMTMWGFKKIMLKVTVQESTGKLLYAQGDESFVDFLCSWLAIPVGGVECLLGGNTCLESIDNLYRSIANMNGDKYMAKPEMKNRLLKPKLPHGYLSGNHKNYMKGPRMYKIADDLYVTPFCIATSFHIFRWMNIPLSDVKELDVEIGTKEAFSLLKASLTSTTALTDGLMINSMLQKHRREERGKNGESSSGIASARSLD